MTNALGNNQIQVYNRTNDGMLTLIQTIATTGGGSGTQLDATDSLGSQGSLMLDQNHEHLFAVNTETVATHSASGPVIGDCQEGSISSFTVRLDGTLALVNKVPSGGLFPNSLTINPYTGLVYVLNAGGPGINPVCGLSPNITGFTVGPFGRITQLAGSTSLINPGMSPGSFLTCDPGGSTFPTYEFQCGLNPPAFPRSPAQIGFDQTGLMLVVTVKGTNSLYMFPVGQDGRPGPPAITKAQGPNQPSYFGFAFDAANHLIVAEPFGVTPTIPASPFSAMSSFTIMPNGAMLPISSDVPNGEGTSCWILLAGPYAYTANNATSNISLYRVGSAGKLSLLDAAAATVNRPNDMAFALEIFNSARFLYVLESGSGSVGVFRILADGSLTFLESVSGLPASAGAQGLAAY